MRRGAVRSFETHHIHNIALFFVYFRVIHTLLFRLKISKHVFPMICHTFLLLFVVGSVWFFIKHHCLCGNVLESCIWIHSLCRPFVYWNADIFSHKYYFSRNNLYFKARARRNVFDSHLNATFSNIVTRLIFDIDFSKKWAIIFFMDLFVLYET